MQFIFLNLINFKRKQSKNTSLTYVCKRNQELLYHIIGKPINISKLMDFLHLQFLFSFKRYSKDTNFPVFAGVSFALICVKIVAFFHYYNVTLNKHSNYNLNFTCILLLFFCIYNSLTYKKARYRFHKLPLYMKK